MAWEDIVVSSKILGHISAGVYRSAGGALKELVNNAFDANATRVGITTNPPSFDIITCSDNGSGMLLQDFHWIMKQGIGESSKRVATDVSGRFNRPLIGRLGIGMLGVAQICHSFQIISHHRESETAFQATVKLVDYLREKVDSVDPEEGSDDIEIDVGKFTVEEIPYDAEKAGTQVVASDVRSAFIKKFRENPGPLLPSKFSSFLDTVHTERSVKELGDYWQMVWELSIACPIPYMDNGPFDWKKVEAPAEFKERFEGLKKNLHDYEFELIVDGLSLRKPNLFPYPTQRRGDNKSMTGRVFTVEKEMPVYGRLLKLFGYIYMQDGQAIEPIDLRGLLIRIRNVAIGGYDPTFIDYPKIEGPRFNWLSGEIYVEEGLEHALNIDRDSFNEMHSHFVRLQDTIHGLLDEVFSEASRSVKRRSQAKRLSEGKRKRQALREVLAQEMKGNYEIIETDDGEEPLTIDTRKKKIFINNRSALWPRSRSKREFAQLIAVAFEVSMIGPEKDQRSRFYKLLTKILSL